MCFISLEMLLGAPLSLLATQETLPAENVQTTQPNFIARAKATVLKILVINEQQLLGAAIINLLRTEPSWETIGFTPECVADLIAKVQEVQPDIIILDHVTLWPDVVYQLLSQPQNFHNFSLMTISTDSNWISVYNIQLLLIKQPNDLATIVHSLRQ